MSRISERLVVQRLIEQVMDETNNVFLEVPSLGQSVDVAWIYNEEITFVEAKVNDWKRALKQCKNHFVVADYIWIVIAMKTISSVLLDEAEKLGIGIMHYKEGVIIKQLEARKNTRVWAPQNEVVKKYLISQKHEAPTLDDICNIC